MPRLKAKAKEKHQKKATSMQNHPHHWVSLKIQSRCLWFRREGSMQMEGLSRGILWRVSNFAIFSLALMRRIIIPSRYYLNDKG